MLVALSLLATSSTVYSACMRFHILHLETKAMLLTQLLLSFSADSYLIYLYTSPISLLPLIKARSSPLQVQVHLHHSVLCTLLASAL